MPFNRQLENTFNMLVFWLLSLVVQVLCQRDELINIYPDFTNHPCNRVCGSQNLQCYYKLTLDRYFTMQPDCFNCSRTNTADCGNPQCMPGDGTRRQVLVFNGALPGPTITVCQGDYVEVDVENRADPETTTVHWHGQHMTGNSWNDGVPMVTQCPIQPFTTWRYQFTATQKGTHFYHSHSAAQRADGAYGHLIVKERSLPTAYDYRYDFDLTDHVISLLDWLTFISDDNIYRYLRTKVFYDDRITSILVNGYGPNRTNNAPYKTFTVQQGRSYRFRVIHAGNIVCPIEMSIDGHKLRVIASDGNYIRPEEVDVLTLMNGERYDFILRANQPVSSYGIRINGSLICNVQSLAILRYGTASTNGIGFQNAPARGQRIMNCLNVDKTQNCINYNQMTSVDPLEPQLQPNANVFKYFLGFDNYNVVFERFAGVLAKQELITPLINEISYRPPTTPLIIEPNPNQYCYFEKKQNCNNTVCECTHVLPIDSRQTAIELIFVDLGVLVNLSHPMHLHGHSFRVIGQEKLGTQVTIERVRQLDQAGRLIRNYTMPIVKDTVAVPDGGYTIVRFVPNPGFWFLHCHVDYHSEEGMQMVLAVEPYPRPPSNFPRCGNYLGGDYRK